MNLFTIPSKISHKRWALVKKKHHFVAFEQCKLQRHKLATIIVKKNRLQFFSPTQNRSTIGKLWKKISIGRPSNVLIARFGSPILADFLSRSYFFLFRPLTGIIGIGFLSVEFGNCVQRVVNGLSQESSLDGRNAPKKSVEDDRLFALVPLREDASQFADLFAEQSARRPLHVGSLISAENFRSKFPQFRQFSQFLEFFSYFYYKSFFSFTHDLEVEFFFSLPLVF